MKGIKNPSFGKKFNQDEIQKRLDRYKDHPETKEKISNSLKEYYKKCSEEGIKTNGKKVRQYDLDGNLIKEYRSISEAARHVNVCNTTISKACEKLTELLVVTDGEKIINKYFNTIILIKIIVL